MMEIIPTWKVRAFLAASDENDEGHEFRVPETNLEPFLHVLIFNGIHEFQVQREPDRGPKWGWHIRDEPLAESLLIDD